MTKVGRPSSYNTQIADIICERLAAGQSLREICRDDEMPDRNTVMAWMGVHEDFAAKYARARDIGLDERADRLRETVETEPDIQRAKLIFEHEKWYLAKLAPKKYGDKVQTEISGSLDVTTKEQRDAAVAAATRADR